MAGNGVNKKRQQHGWNGIYPRLHGARTTQNRTCFRLLY